jgi:hypothetical protein
MGLGKPNRSDLKAFSLKIKTKDLPKPEFVELPDRENTVSGTLIGVEPKETKWENKLIKSVNVTLTDGDQIFFVTIPYSNLGRSLMNAILNLKSFDDVEIGLYQTKPKTDGGKTYPAASLRQAGEIVRWRFENKDLPAPEEIIFKGEKMRDYTKMETFFAAQLKELNNVVKAKAPAKVASAASVDQPVQEDTSDPVPF